MCAESGQAGLPAVDEDGHALAAAQRHLTFLIDGDARQAFSASSNVPVNRVGPSSRRNTCVSIPSGRARPARTQAGVTIGASVAGRRRDGVGFTQTDQHLSTESLIVGVEVVVKSTASRIVQHA